MCSSFAFAFVVGDFTLQSQLISDNKSQKAKDLHISGNLLTYLIAPEPVLIVRSEGVDDDRDGQRQNEDAAQGAEAT